MRARYTRVYFLPAALAVAGPTVLVVATGGGFWPFALGWWVVTLVVASIKSRAVRIAVTIAALPICVLTTFEGGLFMLPAVFTLLVLDAGHSVSPPKRTAQHSPH